MNMLFWSRVRIQKDREFAKNWQVPLVWHSMYGLARKSSRQEPGLMRDCPPPPSPLVVGARNEYPIHILW